MVVNGRGVILPCASQRIVKMMHCKVENLHSVAFRRFKETIFRKTAMKRFFIGQAASPAFMTCLDNYSPGKWRMQLKDDQPELCFGNRGWSAAGCRDWRLALAWISLTLLTECCEHMVLCLLKCDRQKNREEVAQGHELKQSFCNCFVDIKKKNHFSFVQKL